MEPFMLPGSTYQKDFLIRFSYFLMKRLAISMITAVSRIKKDVRKLLTGIIL